MGKKNRCLPTGALSVVLNVSQQACEHALYLVDTTLHVVDCGRNVLGQTKVRD
jgi:hypothetical protein